MAETNIETGTKGKLFKPKKENSSQKGEFKPKKGIKAKNENLSQKREFKPKKENYSNEYST